jgi:hypothetical protein
VTYTDAEILGELLEPDSVRHDEGDHVALGGIPVHAAVLHHGACLQLRFNLTGDHDKYMRVGKVVHPVHTARLQLGFNLTGDHNKSMPVGKVARLVRTARIQHLQKKFGSGFLMAQKKYRCRYVRLSLIMRNF